MTLKYSVSLKLHFPSIGERWKRVEKFPNVFRVHACTRSYSSQVINLVLLWRMSTSTSRMENNPEKLKTNSNSASQVA